MLTKKQFIKKHGDLGKALLDNYELKHAIEAIENNYYGEYWNREEFVRNYMSERADEMLPNGSFEKHILTNWCNWEHVAWELFINDFTDIEVNGKTHVFSVF